MSIQEQAQQLAALAEQVPQGEAQAVLGRLSELQQQVVGIVGDTPGAMEINGAISQAIATLESVTAALEQVKQVIAAKAAYHQG